MILCDTDILIEFYKNNALIIRELKHIGQINMSVSAITQAELYFGALDKRELKKIDKHLTTISRFALDNAISECFLLLMKTYSLSHKIGLPDALIAATALVHGASLYTLNIKHFQFIPQLKLHKPVTY
ncbi:MAG: type II toxin-antitoxin system VapC family toxin [Desulfamplus sp.]|nr:type II toxin-antitoxin system VapC family toxin [Desulfamplus sp.]